MFWVLHRDAVEAEEVSILGDDLARKLHGGLLPASYAKQYAQEFRAGEGLRSLGKQPLARPEFRRKLLYGVAAASHHRILLRRARIQ